MCRQITILKKLLSYETIILPAVLYGYRTWVVITRGVNGVKIFEYRIVREISGSTMDEAA
jgi:hypothetical protein